MFEIKPIISRLHRRSFEKTHHVKWFYLLKKFRFSSLYEWWYLYKGESLDIIWVRDVGREYFENFCWVYYLIYSNDNRNDISVFFLILISMWSNFDILSKIDNPLPHNSSFTTFFHYCYPNYSTIHFNKTSIFRLKIHPFLWQKIAFIY